MTNMDYAIYYVRNRMDLPTHELLDKTFRNLKTKPEKSQYRDIMFHIYALLESA